MIFTSRSRIETFQACARKGYLNFLWGGRGLVKRAASVYLSTGTFTHIGLEYLLKIIKNFGANNDNTLDENIIDDAVHLAVTAYWKEVTARGLDLEEGENKENEKFVVMEQCALVEAFIRSFAIRVLPDILSRFRIVDVEREEIVQVDNNLILQARLDAVMEEIETSDLYIDSFKTAATWDRRQEKSNEHDNQGLSETWVLENRLRQENLGISNVINLLNSAKSSNIKITQATQKYTSYVSKFLKNEKVMGVIMIYLLKGKRYESSSHPGRWEQHSPLIRAYRKLQGTDYEYAPHLYYDNPTNKSGKGRLGKGWEVFNVWENEEIGGVKGWIKMLSEGKVGGDVIGEAYKIPSPYFRNQQHLDSWFRQHVAIEKEIESKLVQLNTQLDNKEVAKGYELISDATESLDILFPQTRKHCHYPTDCQYLDICYNQEVFNDPVGSGLYLWRVPHHKAEKEEHEKLYKINNIQNTSDKNGFANVGQKDGEEIREREKKPVLEEVGEDEEVIIVE